MTVDTKKLFRFCVVGGVVAAFDLGCVRLLAWVIPPLMAVGIAYILAVGLHFCLNRWWVFAATDGPAASQMKRYAVAVAACWACTLAISALCLSTLTSHVLVAKIVAIPPVTLLGFVLMRSFVFRSPFSEAPWQFWG